MSLIACSRRGAADYAALGFDPARIGSRPTPPPPGPYPRRRHSAHLPIPGIAPGPCSCRALAGAQAGDLFPVPAPPCLRSSSRRPAHRSAMWPARPWAVRKPWHSGLPCRRVPGRYPRRGTAPSSEQAGPVRPARLQRGWRYSKPWHALPVIVAAGDGTPSRPGAPPPPAGMCSSGDLTALTATLAEALSDPARLRRMGADRSASRAKRSTWRPWWPPLCGRCTQLWESRPAMEEQSRD